MNKGIYNSALAYDAYATPSTTKQFAFFDVDETLIYEKSMFAMLHAIEKNIGGIKAQHAIDRLQSLREGGADRISVNRAYYALLSGYKQQDVMAVAKFHVRARIENHARAPYFIEAVRDQLLFLQSLNIPAVLISGSCIDFLEPLRRYFGAAASLATCLSIDKDGYYTGHIKGHPVIGPGKLSLITQFATQQGADLSQCHGYGDHASDIDFLSAVGWPTVVGNNEILHKKAKSLGWKVISSGPLSPQNATLK